MNTTNRRSNFFPFLTAFAAAALLVLTPAVSEAQQPGYGAPQYNDQQNQSQDQQADPPSRVGRLSVMQGNVSFQPASAQDFSAAEVNYPLTNGDRLYTDNGARAELEAGQLAVRLGQQTDFTVTSLTDDFAQFGLAQGSVHLRAYALDPSTTTEIDTPNASISILQPGDIRVDVDPQGNSTVVTVLSGQVQVNAENVQQVLQAGQSLSISFNGAQLVRRPRADDLDRFSGQRDAQYQQAYSSEGSYINPDTIGAADLASYGDWSNDGDYGAVWYPRGLAVDWAPYSAGRWVNIAPWGWTWVGAEPWGFAPFHYGRWNRFGNRWGWIPGPPVVRPVYSPALVVFVGGAGFSFGGGLSISIGGGGVAAWFPLGPREVYRPWYRASPVYVNRVNVTNIYNRNPAEVRAIYNNRRDYYGNNTTNNYVNRSVATVAVPQRNFGSGRPVRESALKGDPRQFQNAPIMNRPPQAPPQQQNAGRPPAQALPPRGTQRPVLDTRGNGNPNGPRGGFNGGRPDNNAGRPAQPQQPAAPSQPANNGFGNGGRGNDNRGNDGRFNNGRPTTQPTPAPAAPVAPAPAPSQPVRNDNGGRGNDGRFNNGRPTTQPTPAPAAPVVQPVAPAPAPSQPVRNDNGGRGNDGRFNNGRPTTQPTPAAPVTPTPTPAPDSARPGPQRQAPDAPVRVNPPFNRPPREEPPSVPVQPRPIVEQPRAVQPPPQPRPAEQPRQEQPRPQREAQPAPQPQAPPAARPAPPARTQPQERPHPQQAPPAKPEDKDKKKD